MYFYHFEIRPFRQYFLWHYMFEAEFSMANMLIFNILHSFYNILTFILLFGRVFHANPSECKHFIRDEWHSCSTWRKTTYECIFVNWNHFCALVIIISSVSSCSMLLMMMSFSLHWSLTFRAKIRCIFILNGIDVMLFTVVHHMYDIVKIYWTLKMSINK